MINKDLNSTEHNTSMSMASAGFVATENAIKVLTGSIAAITVVAGTVSVAGTKNCEDPRAESLIDFVLPIGTFILPLDDVTVDATLGGCLVYLA
jgi:hypothetical protein